MNYTPTTPASENADVASRPASTTVAGSGKGSFVIGLTVTAIAAFALLTLLTPLSGSGIRWFAPLALAVAGVLALVRRR